MTPLHASIPGQIGANDLVTLTNIGRNLGYVEACLEGWLRLRIADFRNRPLPGAWCPCEGTPIDCYVGEPGCPCDGRCLEARRASLDYAEVRKVPFWGDRLDRAALRLSIRYEAITDWG